MPYLTNLTPLSINPSPDTGGQLLYMSPDPPKTYLITVPLHFEPTLRYDSDPPSTDSQILSILIGSLQVVCIKGLKIMRYIALGGLIG